ncbi:cytochrome P450 [Coniophora puteana RWD-64-598 SS2]|uniref:Cytochrome P450 n=1 Tax=Coniophora puteana (strain RWD-64-598) TaxID=741705 RepID=A0A5M3ME57_CONPW|nr:cytochrome P450 [Coniophora puteana RWD-64-598 SS2]EIW77084.1 cytochrome P450 [Coniophora puteana RWD-64-598 SS2]
MDVFSSLPYSVPLLLAVTGTVFLGLRRRKANAEADKGLKFPPGPKPLPVIGNIFDVGLQEPWITYYEQSRKYGDIAYYSIFGQNTIVIHSEKIARDLFERRSLIYSDRPTFPTLEPYGIGFATFFMRYGDTWRAHRKMFQQTFKPAGSASFQPMQLRKVHQLLQKLLTHPGDYVDHIELLAAGIIMSVTYEYEVEPHSDPLVNIITNANSRIIHVGSVDKSIMIGLFPFLKYVPSWLPGGVMNAADCRNLVKDALNIPFEHLRKKLNEGTNGHSSLGADSLQSFGDRHTEEQIAMIKDACMTSFSAGAETTVATILTAMVALVLHPEAQKLGQQEIDRVVGSHRLPNFEDRASLPYLEAIYRESLRWHPVSPLGVPHSPNADDVYDGYLIPKGSVVFFNNWSISRDEARFPSPEEFKPERWLKPDGSIIDDEPEFAFGFGRRVCPGRHVADATVWSALACMLAVYNLEKPKGADGRPVDFEPTWVSGLSSAPHPFPCNIVPRDPAMYVAALSERIAASEP